MDKQMKELHNQRKNGKTNGQTDGRKSERMTDRHTESMNSNNEVMARGLQSANFDT
jgi:hypothetical protein